MKLNIIILFIVSFISARAEPALRLPNDSLSAFNKITNQENRYLKIGRIIIVGNKKTKAKIILRELEIKEGDFVYEEDLLPILELDRNKIYNLRLFNTVLIRPLEIERGLVDILIEVSERWYLFPVPLFELADRNFNDWWQNQGHDLSRVNYGVKLYYNNVRGRNEALRLTLQGGFLRNAELIYRIPYLDRSQRHGMNFGYSFSETKNLPYITQDHIQQFLRTDDIIRYSSRGFVGYTYRKNFYEFHSISADYSYLNVADTITFLNPNYFRNGESTQRMASISYSYNRDKRDIAAYPLKGYQFTGFLARYGLGLNDDINRVDMSVSYAKFMDLKKGYYFSNFSYLYLSLPSEQPYFIYAGLGYRRFLVRGYELYLIEGPQIVMNKTTFKKKIFASAWNLNYMPIDQFRHLPFAIYLKSYLDLGFVNSYPNYTQPQFLTNRFLGGTGIGLDFVSSYDSVLRLEYSINRQGEHGFFFHLKKEF